MPGARKAPSLRVCAKCGAGGAELLGIVGQATTFVARLAIIRISRQTRSIGDLFRGSQQRYPVTMPDAAIDSQQEHDPSRNDLASPSFQEVRQPGAATGAVARRAGLGSGNLLAYAKRPGTGSPTCASRLMWNWREK
jgi:hypothetical protein